jgi:sec-independent protein translocase protein TatB
MFDIGWTELLVIGVVALVVIGPKDLPIAIKAVGKWVGKARQAAREFQDTFDEMVREAELDQARKQMQALTDLPGEIERKFNETTKEFTAPVQSILGDSPAPPAAATPAPASPVEPAAAPPVGTPESVASSAVSPPPSEPAKPSAP